MSVYSSLMSTCVFFVCFCECNFWVEMNVALASMEFSIYGYQSFFLRLFFNGGAVDVSF